MPKESRKVVYVAIAGNAAVAVSKFAAAIFTGSSAMLSEGFHSSADTGNELLLLLGQKRSERPADEQHPFGHGRELYFWAFIVAMSVFAVGGGLSIYEGVSRLLHPTALENPTWNYVVLGLAFVFEGYSWSVAHKELNQRREPGESLWRVIHTSKDPSVFTVFMEDSAALIGLVIAFLGVFLSHVFRMPRVDAAASVLIGLLLVLAAMALAVESGGLLVGESGDADKLKDMCRIIAEEPTVERVGKALTMQLGPDEVLLVADVGFRSELGARELERAVDTIERRIQEAYPSVTRIYFEAESFKTERSSDRAA